MHKIIPYTMAACLLTGVSAIAEETQATSVDENKPKVYILPDDVKCYIRKQDKITFCTDLNNAPITGELQKYQEAELIRKYPIKDGIIQGTVVAYYANGDIMSEKTYKKGKLDGEAKTYYKGNKIKTLTPYKQGKKEGVGKVYYENGFMQEQGIYINNKLNGKYRLYEENGEMVYELIFKNNDLVSGYCVYKKKNDERKKRYKKELTAEQIDLLRRNKIMLQFKILEDKCAMKIR